MSSFGWTGITRYIGTESFGTDKRSIKNSFWGW